MKSETQRTLNYLRRSEYHCGVTEHWFQQPGMSHGRRKDLFGVIDIIALGEGETLGVQTTSKGGMSARFNKMTGRRLKFSDDEKKRKKEVKVAEDIRKSMEAMFASGWRIVIIGWEKESKHPTIRYVEPTDLLALELDPKDESQGELDLG